ncbi:MAG TPA: hypothetical protein VN258_00770 [Mobilitalea sp.]|nr:hypothetical protein [Mobilitalea sp.]
MLSIDLKLEQTREMLCSEARLATISVWLKRRYEMIFSQFWKFKLLPSHPDHPGIISDRIFIENDNTLELLEHYHGIRVAYKDMKDTEEIINIAAQELKKGLPIAVEINDLYFPWVPEKKKDDSLFPCFVTGISEDEIFCLDIHGIKKSAPIPKSDFLKGYEGCITFSAVSNEKDKIDWHTVIAHNTTYLIENNSFEAMRELAKLITDSINDKTEVSELDALCYKIKYIYHSRYLFSQFLEYLINQHQSDALVEYKDRFVFLSHQWLSLWGLISSTLVQHKLNISADFPYARLRSVAGKLCNIADLEENLCRDMINTLEGLAVSSPTVYKASNKDLHTDRLQYYHFVDLTDYLNNNGFHSNTGTCTAASLTLTGQVFLTKGLPMEPVWNTHGMKFHFPYPVDGKDNNISCLGQKIMLQKECYSYLMFLGCAEWGHYSELMEIHYLDGTVSRSPLEFTDWSYPDSHFGEYVVWEGACGEKDNDGKLQFSKFLKVHLYASALQLDSGRELDYIGLPDCSNIHIFAITLGKQ